MRKPKVSGRVVAALAIACVSGLMASTAALADDRHDRDRDWHHDRDWHRGHDRDWHRPGVVVEGPEVVYAPPPMVYAPPPPPPLLGFGLDIRLH
jgi:hypothetical protein